MATLQSFPGVYVQVFDQSFLSETASSFRCGLIGVAERGAFDTPTATRSFKDFVRQFGGKVSAGNFMAQSASFLSAYSDGTVCVRVGNRYATKATANVTGSGTAIFTANANLFNVSDYVRLTQEGKVTSINLKVASVVGNEVFFYTGAGYTSSGTVSDAYTAATASTSPGADAANAAEGFLRRLTYSGVPVLVGTGTLTVSAVKNSSTASVSSSSLTTSGAFWNGGQGVAVGDVLKLVEASKSTTREVLVKAITPYSNGANGTIEFETAGLANIGYQPVYMQDDYTAARLYKANKTGSVFNTSLAVQLYAATEGTWANTSGTSGLQVLVSPGSNDDTKKFLVYENGALVETIDRLTFDDTTATSYAETVINADSSYLTCAVLDGTEPPANTLSGWNSGSASPAGNTINVATFAQGANGENPTASDYIGTFNASTEQGTGLKSFADVVDDLPVNVIAVADSFDITSNKVGASTPGIPQEATRIARQIHAVHVFSVPSGVNARSAKDWHNARGTYTSTGVRLDDSYAAIYWNWVKTTDPFDGSTLYLPAHLAACTRFADTFDRFAPWFAAAGEVRGIIPFASDVEWGRISEDAKQAFYGNGQSINAILKTRNSILVFGDRTLQRAESKLTALHSQFLVNYIVYNLGQRGRKFVFEPNDDTLLAQIASDFSQFLDGVKVGRGIEAYNLVVDHSNNTAATRNAREVNVDLSVIPTDVAERIYLNITVRESGGILNSIG